MRVTKTGSEGSAVVELVEGAPDLNEGEIDIFVGRDYVLSIRKRTQQGFREVRHRCEREPELLRNGSGFVLYALMDNVVDRYFPVVDRLTELIGQWTSWLSLIIVLPVALMQVAAHVRTYTFASVSSYLEGAGYAKINLHPNDWSAIEDRAYEGSLAARKRALRQSRKFLEQFVG